MPDQPAAVPDRPSVSTAAAPYRSGISLSARAASGLVWVYQRTVSPALAALDPAGGCRFSPTCSHYARLALLEHGFLTGSWLAARRLLKCGPWHAGGEDPVPPRAGPVCTRISAA